MTALRILGGVFAVAFFALALVRYRRRRISRLNLMLSCLISSSSCSSRSGRRCSTRSSRSSTSSRAAASA
jgi:hypothetical protein